VNSGLWYLLRAGFRGFFRRMGRRMRTFRGFVSTLFGVIFFLILVGSQVMAMLVDRRPSADHDPAVLTFSLLLMLLLIPSVVAADAPFFWPQEVQFLFPAPLGRRELLAYQMMNRGWVQVFSATWLGIMGMRTAPLPAAALLAAVLAMLFLFALAQLSGLAKVAAGDRLPRAVVTAVKPLLGVMGIVAAFAFYRRTQAVGAGQAVGELFASPWMRIATLPGRPFGELFASRSAAEALAWTTVSAALVLGTAAVAIVSAVDFRERSLVSSARRFDRLRRMRAGRGAYAGTGPANRRIPVPALGFLGPAAPIARRQMFELGRGLRALWSLFFTAGLAFFYVVVIPGIWREGSLRSLGVTMLALIVVFPLLASGGFSIDFRRDLERMAYLRSLPLPPMAVAVGQVFTSAVLIALVNLALLAIAGVMADWRVDPALAALAAVGAIPIAWLAVTLENWLFLLFPTRTQADGGQQNAFVGKQLLKMFFKMIFLAVVVAFAAGVALVGAWLAGDVGAAAGVALIVALACFGATALLARAYRSFDLTVDSPA
jgi:hypothetical protein